MNAGLLQMLIHLSILYKQDFQLYTHDTWYTITIGPDACLVVTAYMVEEME